MLVRWMAEHLRGLLDRYKAAVGDEKDRLGRECSDIILRIWGQRHELPQRARPLESFEPLFNALEQLSEGPRSHYFRHAPVAPEGSEIGKALEIAISLDNAASTLIRYILAEAMGSIPQGDKKWLKLAADVKPSAFDTRILGRLQTDQETMEQQADRLQKEQIDQIETMIVRLTVFEQFAISLRKQFDKQLGKLSKKKT